MSSIKTTAFLSVFEVKLEKLYDRIRDEYNKPKAERNKQSLKSLAHEAKKLKKLVVEMKEQTSVECKCPACGHKFKVK